MKKSLVTLLLVFATAAVAQQAPGADPAAAQAGQAQSAGQPASGGQLSFKDPAESNAFYAAYNSQDPATRATSLESFLQSYPNSIAKKSALELLMQTYQQTSNMAKLQETAQRLLQVDPNSVSALGTLAYMNFQAAQQGNAQAWPQAAKYSEQGLQALQTKPEGIDAAAWDKQKKTLTVLFENSIGLNAIQQKDFPTAQKALSQVIELTPDDPTAAYYLATAELEQKPIVIEGLFWGAKAISLAQQKGANAQQVDGIRRYVRYKYMKYHGGDEGFDALVQAAATMPTPPAGFTVAPAPSPADQAAEMIKGKEAKDLSFGEWEFILTSGNQQASDFIWNGIKGKPVAMQGWVATAATKSLSIFGTEDAKNENKPDIVLNLTEAIPAARLPKPGALIGFQGIPDSFAPQPNFVMTMTDGIVKLPGGATAGAKPSTGSKAGAKAPAKRTTPRKK